MKSSTDYSPRILIFGAWIVVSQVSPLLFGQGSATYPYVSPTAAASGMTSGLERGATSETMNMMQVRAAAQEADRAAAAAAMARSAESAIEEAGLKSALQKARRTRQAKVEASEKLKWQRVTAYNAYNSVSSSEMSTWKDENGRVKVGRGLPNDFVQSVQAEQAARAASAPKKKSFAPIKNISNKVTEAVGIEEPISDTGLAGPKPLPDVQPSQGREGRFGFKPPKLGIPKIKAPKLSFPKIGNRSQAPPQPAPSNAPQRVVGNAAAVAASASAAATSVASSIGSSSAAPAAPPKPAAPKPVTIQQSRSAADMLRSDSGAQKKSGGLFSRKSSGDSKLFSFGKKSQPAAPQPVVSSGLFPTGMVPTTQGAKPSSSGSLPPVSSTPSNNRTVVSLPGSAPAPQKKRFSLPKPKFSVPKVSSVTSGVSPTSTVNRNGNSFYVVNSSAQFMKYGNSRTDTTIRALGPGTVVQMTKPGNDWATVQLPDGSSGVIQTKNLRGASSGEVPSGFGSGR